MPRLRDDPERLEAVVFWYAALGGAIFGAIITALALLA
jgi:hypothetical protein